GRPTHVASRSGSMPSSPRFRRQTIRMASRTAWRPRATRLRPYSPHPVTMRSLWPSGGLWRHPDFLKLWSAETVSQFGTQVSQLALPLAAVLVLDASAFEVAALGVV